MKTYNAIMENKKPAKLTILDRIKYYKQMIQYLNENKNQREIEKSSFVQIHDARPVHILKGGYHIMQATEYSIQDNFTNPQKALYLIKDKEVLGRIDQKEWSNQNFIIITDLIKFRRGNKIERYQLNENKTFIMHEHKLKESQYLLNLKSETFNMFEKFIPSVQDEKCRYVVQLNNDLNTSHYMKLYVVKIHPDKTQTLVEKFFINLEGQIIAREHNELGISVKDLSIE